MKIKEELIRVVLDHMIISLEELSAKFIKNEIKQNINVEIISVIPHKDNTLLYKKFTITFYECNQLIYVIDYTMRLKELVEIKIT